VDVVQDGEFSGAFIENLMMQASPSQGGKMPGSAAKCGAKIVAAWAASILACMIFTAAPAAAETSLPKARDVGAESRSAAAAGKAYLLFYAEAGCEFCERARTTHLLAMAADEKMRARVVMRQIDIDSDAALEDFAGRSVSHRSFARAQGVRLYPTIVLYGPDGRQTAERLTGFTNPDYYGYSVERRIDAALSALPKR
jgi:thioredoxin-related protein